MGRAAASPVFGIGSMPAKPVSKDFPVARGPAVAHRHEGDDVAGLRVGHADGRAVEGDECAVPVALRELGAVVEQQVVRSEVSREPDERLGELRAVALLLPVAAVLGIEQLLPGASSRSSSRASRRRSPRPRGRNPPTAARRSASGSSTAATTGRDHHARAATRRAHACADSTSSRRGSGCPSHSAARPSRSARPCGHRTATRHRATATGRTGRRQERPAGGSCPGTRPPGRRTARTGALHRRT